MNIPQHIAIIMDGNGRWAKKRLLPRVAGHKKGVASVKKIITHANAIGVKYLTLFAFGRDNWKRPAEEVNFLMKLLSEQIKKEFKTLIKKNAVINFIGDRSRLNPTLIGEIQDIEMKSAMNDGIIINFAVDYSGSYDISQAMQKIIDAGHKTVNNELIEQYLLTAKLPHPDLLIRTGGEKRISDFMLWQIAYSEIYFTDTMWPDFDEAALDESVEWFTARERRFGKISEQLSGRD